MAGAEISRAPPVSNYGSLEIHRIVEIDRFALQLDFLFPGAALEALAPARPWLEGAHVDWRNSDVLLAVQSHLVHIGGKTILIDSCVGEHKQRPARPEWHQRSGTDYLARLAAAGCAPGDVDFVMCTHLHADHVGWNTRLEDGRWTPTFKNARYLIGKAELEYTAQLAADNPLANHSSFQDSVLPIVEHGLAVKVVAGEVVADNVRVLALPGHTMGQIGLEIAADDGENLVFCGDAIHSPAQIQQPQWSSRFCHDPAQAEQTRRNLLTRAAAERLRLAPNHLRAGSLRISACAGCFIPHFED